MNLNEYFSNREGLGIISTASNQGETNSAIYAKPHMLGDDRLAFIMRDRLIRANLLENPQASYMFVEHSGGLSGLRLQLSMEEESTDSVLIQSLSRRTNIKESEDKPRFLVSFKVKKAISLIGGNEIEMN